MAERRTLDIAAPRGGIASGSAERDPANELYDQACSLLEAAQGLCPAAGLPVLCSRTRRLARMHEASLQELRDAVPELRDTALTTPADAKHVVGLPTLTKQRAWSQRHQEWCLLCMDRRRARRKAQVPAR